MMTKAQGMKIRAAKRRDIPSFMSNIARAKSVGNCAPKAYFSWMVRDGIALVAEDQEEEKPIGFVLAERNGKAAAHVNYVFVHRKYRGQGIGGLLMKRFLYKCRRQGIKYIDLNAKKNTVGFYRNFGFRSEGKYAVLYKKI